MKDNGTVSLKDRLIQSVQIVIFGLLTLALTVLTVLELIPAKTKGLQVKECFEVASFAVDSTGVRFISSLHGSFQNDSGETLAVEDVTVLLSDGKIRREVSLDDFTLPARREQTFELNFEGDLAVNTVVRIEASVNGERTVLENQGATGGVGGVPILYLVLLIPSVLLCVRAVRVRYYLWQESQLTCEKM